ncbi:unnamed protein product [Mytilus coruscus]|uniref:Integrase zinc-binding domain-containing protein n=1 Tax=Mytilus coruscus TaxID=42192 RepID=A0A6J7ZTR0_MYTCO|nr:unnamed protein product [Mytilus coruscus]
MSQKIPSQLKEVSQLADEICEVASSEENVLENSLLSSGDIVLMQTAQTTVPNTEVNETKVSRSVLESSTIEILVGNDYYLDIILPQKIEIQQGLYLLGSKLGWILTGRSQLNDEERENKMTMTVNGLLSITECCLNFTIDKCLQIKPSIEDFWNLETIGIKDCPYTSDDENTLSNFITPLKMENGRYQVAWPWKEKLSELPENRELAYGRLKVPFGVISSPFLLAATLDYHLETYKNATAANIRENIYVDNVITGVDSTDIAVTLYKEAKQIFSAASMNLREWASNSQEFLKSIPKEDQTNREKIKEYHIPRAIGLPGNVTFSLLCFCDASTKAYASAVYLHQLSENNVCKIVSISSKTRLVPNKKITLPRLELLAVAIGVRCIDFVKKQLKFPVCETILWTDSQCVLHWIGTKKPLATFVDNRTKEVRQQKDIQFQYVSTKENPADIASRGTTVSLLKENSQWWHGPSWLTKHRTEWPRWDPHNISVDNQNSIESKYKISKVLHEAKLLAGESPDGETNSVGYLFDIDCSRFSSFIRLIRVSAWVIRFVKQLKKEMLSGPLTATELEHAKLLWIKSVQKQSFGNVMIAIKENKSHNLVGQLGLIVDQKNVIRCIGRLEAAQLSEGAKTPILLPKKNKVTELLIENMHRKYFHVGVSQTLSAMRQTYWIPQGRSEVKRVLRKCTICKRCEGGPYKMPLMPPLPKKRVNESASFTYTGVDYFGPIYVKSDTGNKKVWVCLYTCLVVRAIHLELMQDMSAEQFFIGFRRFIARWGNPKQIISDNGS